MKKNIIPLCERKKLEPFEVFSVLRTVRRYKKRRLAELGGDIIKRT